MSIGISKKGIICIFLYVFFLLLYMLILPFGDEPDFNRRGLEYLSIFSSLNWSYFEGLIPIVENPNNGVLNTASECISTIDAMQIYGKYDFNTCPQVVELALKRSLLTLVIFFPIFIPILFGRFRNYNNSIILQKYSFNRDSLSISLLFPGFIYYSSVFSLEQVCLMLSLFFIYSFCSSKYFLGIASLSLFLLLDQGNAQAFIVIFLYIIFSIYIYKLLGFNKFLLINALFFITGFFGAESLLPFLSNFNDKLGTIYHDYTNSPAINDHPLILRPIMTFMSYNIMPPAYSKHPLVYLIVGLGICYTFFK